MKLWIDRTAWASPRARRRAPLLQAGDIESIAVIKHGALGDMVLTRPFFKTLRRHFPRANLTLSAVSHYQEGLPRDLVDRVHITPGKDLPGRGAAARLLSRAALGRHDLLFDLTCSAQSFWITMLNAASLKIGFMPRGLHKLSYPALYDLAVPRTEYKFEAETFLDQLNALGLMHSWPLEFGLPMEPPPPADGPYILFFVSASAPYKCWPAERFAEVMRRLAGARPNLRPAILAGREGWEQELAEKAAELSGLGAGLLWCRDSQQSWSWVSAAKLLISNDTGVRNYAIAAGTPTLGIFTRTLPFRYLPRFGDHAAVYDSNGEIPAAEAVVQAAHTLLDRPRSCA